MNDNKPILRMDNITKQFPGVKALEAVHLNVFKGEVMALLGENGAGKSTLMKILSGVYKNEVGSIFMEEDEIYITSPKNAMDLGIGIIHQELNLISELTVGENIFLGKEPVTSINKIDWKKLYDESDILLEKLGTKIKSNAIASTLSIGDQQMVEIAKALSVDAKIIIFDEPTDALTDNETQNLFRVIKELKAQGKGLVYISHRLPEVFKICDRVTVLRDGQFIGEKSVSQINEDDIIEMMVGRKLTDQIPFSPNKAGKILLDVEMLNSATCKNINFNIKKGEIVGIAGLMGAGRTEMALTIFGLYPAYSGIITLDDEVININSPAKAINKGIAYVSEDRKQLGLFLGLSVKDNITLPALKLFEKSFYKTDELERNIAVDEFIDKLTIKTTDRNQLVGDLSGGNQQKISIARGLITKPKLLILDEPTRGVDVGAKKEIYKLINKFKNEGLAVLMISSEMPELLGISDRILVMHNQTISGELSRENASQELIMKMAAGLKEKISE